MDEVHDALIDFIQANQVIFSQSAVHAVFQVSLHLLELVGGVTRAGQVVHKSIKLVLGLHFFHRLFRDFDAALPILLNYLIQLAHAVLNDDFGTLWALDSVGSHLLLRGRVLVVIARTLCCLHQVIDGLSCLTLIDAPFLPLLLDFAGGDRGVFIVGAAGGGLNFDLEL